MAKTKVKSLKKVKRANSKAPVAKKTAVKKQNVTLSGKGKTLKGLVISAKMSKTVTVIVEHRKTHPLYGKSFRRSKKYLVHDEIGVAEGDVVSISQIKPISKNKHFAVIQVVGKDIETIVAGQLKEDAAEEIAEVMPEKEDLEEPKESEEPKKPEVTSKKKKKKEDKE